MPTVVLAGTLDTKGHEYAFLRDRVREHGVDVLLVDVGVYAPQVEPDISRQEVAKAAGEDAAGAGRRRRPRRGHRCHGARSGGAAACAP